MMSDEDIKEFHDLDKLKSGLKKSNKYNYIRGKKLTDPSRIQGPGSL